MIWLNEIDPFPAATLRNLIDRGILFPGVVDERSVTDVKAADLVRFRQCHLFAGIGCFPLGLRLAGMPAEFSIWTFGWPCQGNSVAGKGKGRQDPRSGLIGEVIRLLEESRELGTRPAWLLAENVPGVRNKGVDGIIRELEGTGYTVLEPVVVGADDIGAPHRRKRVWLVGNRIGPGVAHGERDGRGGLLRKSGCRENRPEQRSGLDREGAGVGRLGAQETELADTQFIARGWERRKGSSNRNVDHRADAGRPQSSGGPQGGCRDGGAEDLLAVSRSGECEPGSEPQQSLGNRGGFRSDVGGSRESELGIPDLIEQPQWIGECGNAQQEFATASGASLCGGMPINCDSPGSFWPARPGQRQHGWEASRLIEFRMGSSADGIAQRLLQPAIGDPLGCEVSRLAEVPEKLLEEMARYANKSGLKAAGNALVWVIPYLLGKWILEQHTTSLPATEPGKGARERCQDQ